MSESPLGEADGSTDSADNSSSVCPTCGDEFKSPKGKRQHHKRTHGESIAKVTLACAGCGENVERWKSQLDRREDVYCSPECYHTHYERPSGADSWLFNSIQVKCDYCGDSTERRPSRVKRSGSVYCSRECADKGHSERMSADGNPKWDGGNYTHYYGPNWSKQRTAALERDGHECQYCGHDGSDLKLCVHHIRKIRHYKNQCDAPEWYERANRLNNLVTLCRSCHGRWEGIPLKPQRR